MLEEFAGLGMHLGNLWRLSPAKTRSLSAENFAGEKGKGGMAIEGTGAIHARGLGTDGTGRGWKVSPSIQIDPGEKRSWVISRVRALFSSSGLSSQMFAGEI